MMKLFLFLKFFSPIVVVVVVAVAVAVAVD